MLWAAPVQKAIRKSMWFIAMIRDLVYNQKKYPKTRNVTAHTPHFKLTGRITARGMLTGAALSIQIPQS